MRDAIAHSRCTLVALEGARGPLTLIAPFDDITPIAGPASWRRRRLGLVAARILDAAVKGTPIERVPGGRRALALPRWQLVPARVFGEGFATRVLLADAVGLGKTIQGGLVAALVRSDHEPHVLVLTPAGVRDQWTDELSGRLGLEAWTADPAACRRARATLPPGVNPWIAHGLVVASIDYVKQPEVLAAAVAVPWDLVIVDEAHHLTSGSDRRAAADALAGRARRVLLVTATPHGGSDEDYAALCTVGARGSADPPAMLVRRDRAGAGLSPAARLRVVRLWPSRAERVLHDALQSYARQVWDDEQGRARLAMTWLIKRAASSPAALLRSLQHRRRILDGGHAAPLDAWLPFEDEVDERDAEDCRMPEALGIAGLGDRARELRVLDDLACRAAAAAGTWRKREWLLRWLRSSREPIVLFTEYRDTLEALAPALGEAASVAVLHGGLARGARSEALARFQRGEARVLAATDVAGEGLNLQSAARTVVSIELPWTPSRLEQRVGRVDRIGQPRAVRAACLVGRDWAEQAVLARVGARSARARLALGGHDARAALEIAAAALGVSSGEHHGPDAPPPPVLACPAFDADPWLDAAAAAWLARAAARREGRLPRSNGPARECLPWARLRPRPGAPFPPSGIVLLFQARASNARHRVVAEAVVALHVSLEAGARRLSIGTLLDALVALATPHAARAAEARLAATAAHLVGRTRAELDRALAAGDRAAMPGGPVQAGLFDRRAIAEAARDRVVRESGAARDAELVAALRADLEPCRPEPPQAIAAFVCW